MCCHRQIYLNDFHRKNSENCLLDQEKQKEKPLTVEDVIEQSRKQGRTLKRIRHEVTC